MIFKMKNPIQHYHWGTSEYLSQLQGIDNPENIPLAELWMGAHSKAPSEILVEDQWVSLMEWIVEHREDTLGRRCWSEFKMLPYLFKILSIKEPLSIQVHPSIPQAIQGYEREQKAGIAKSSPQRNYKDKNHKPEIICALSDFWALKGFRKFDEIQELLDFTPDFVRNSLRGFLHEKKSEQHRSFYLWLMDLNGDETEMVLESTNLMNPHREESRWVKALMQAYPGDISALAPLYLNLIHLKPGDSLFQPAGEMHAYLKGNGIELMANSDNVLRGGLTSKHMDIPELNGIVNFTPSVPKVSQCKEHYFPSPVKDFRLGWIEGRNTERITTSRLPTILLNMGKPLKIMDDTGISMVIGAGHSIFADRSTQYVTLEGQEISIFWALPGVV